MPTDMTAHPDHHGTADEQHDHDHPHDHDHGAHGHGADENDHGDHEHPTGLKGIIVGIFAPHSHDAADSLDDALESNERGIRAVKISFVALMITSLLQLGVIIISGSVALLADTIHNFSDALTAVPLFIAFRLAKRPPTRRFTYGYGRAEDLAGLFVIAMISLSAIVAAIEAIRRLIHPQAISHLGWVAAAGIVGFLGNELVALYRIREGQAIGSAALVADGYHARTDGFTSLAVVLGAVGTWAGWRYADPVAGLVISIAILAVLRTAIIEVVRRMLNAVDSAIPDAMEHAAGHVAGVDAVTSVQVRWEGHRLHGEVAIAVDPTLTVDAAHELAHRVEHDLQHAVRHLDAVTVHVEPTERDGHHHPVSHH